LSHSGSVLCFGCDKLVHDTGATALSRQVCRRIPECYQWTSLPKSESSTLIFGYPRLYIHTLVKNANDLDKAFINFTKENNMPTYLIFTVAVTDLSTIAPLQVIGGQSMKAFIQRG
jgi:hypothetical protein